MRRILIIGSFILLLISLPVGMYLIKQQQTLKSRASEERTKIEAVNTQGQIITETQTRDVKIKLTYAAQPSPSPTPSPTPILSANSNATPETEHENETIFRPNVLAVFINPREGSRTLSSVYDNLDDNTLQDQENRLLAATINYYHDTTNGIVNYHIANKLHLDTFPPHTDGTLMNIDNYRECTTHNGEGVLPKQGGGTITCEAQKWTIDYDKWITDNHICEAANDAGVDEIWLSSRGFVMTYEGSMVSPDPTRRGFGTVGPIHLGRTCHKPYIIQGCFYPTTSMGNPHCFGHRVEGTMNFITSSWRPEDRNKHWEKFANVSRYATSYTDNERNAIPYVNPNNGSTLGCGNAHFPVNGVRHYDYGNNTNKDFNCLDWKNFPNYTEVTENINCNAWGCNDEGWQKKWLGSIPRRNGEITLTSTAGVQFQFKKNWWYYLLYPDNAIAAYRAASPDPTPGLFTNLSAELLDSRTTFNFSYSGISPSFSIDISTNGDMANDIYLNFASGNGNLIQDNVSLRRWDKYSCGKIVYWRIYNHDRTVQSPIQSALVCPYSVTHFRIANDAGSLNNSPEQVFGPNPQIIDWTLTDGAGQKTIYAQFKVGGSWQQPLVYSLTYNPPVNASPIPSPSPSPTPSSSPIPSPSPLPIPSPTPLVTPPLIATSSGVRLATPSASPSIASTPPKPKLEDLDFDFNHDGKVNSVDFAIFLRQFLPKYRP